MGTARLTRRHRRVLSCLGEDAFGLSRAELGGVHAQRGPGGVDRADGAVALPSHRIDGCLELRLLLVVPTGVVPTGAGGQDGSDCHGHAGAHEVDAHDAYPSPSRSRRPATRARCARAWPPRTFPNYKDCAAGLIT